MRVPAVVGVLCLSLLGASIATAQSKRIRVEGASDIQRGQVSLRPTAAERNGIVQLAAPAPDSQRTNSAGVESAEVAADTANSYRVTVTRKESNLYRVDGTRVFVKTKFCYQYSYSENAVLTYDKYSYNNSLFFLSSKTSCDVESLLSED